MKLEATTRGLGKLIKHTLAFANTPRRTDAYIVFGVQENKELGKFEHVGVPEQGFPNHERVNDIIKNHTLLEDIFIDANFLLNEKTSPLILLFLSSIKDLM